VLGERLDVRRAVRAAGGTSMRTTSRTVVEVLPEPLGLDVRREVAVGRRHDPDVDLA
jgi:hypothetical protein